MCDISQKYVYRLVRLPFYQWKPSYFLFWEGSAFGFLRPFCDFDIPFCFCKNTICNWFYLWSSTVCYMFYIWLGEKWYCTIDIKHDFVLLMMSNMVLYYWWYKNMVLYCWWYQTLLKPLLYFFHLINPFPPTTHKIFL